MLPESRGVQFQTMSEYDLPDQTLLEFHLAICNVIHATGMAEEIERYLDDLEAMEDMMPLEHSVARWIMQNA